MACVTNLHLLVTTRTIHPGVELVIELAITMITLFPITFCLSVYGPLQWWQSRSGDGDAFLGAWELVGVIGLFLLLVIHSGLFVWACRRCHQRGRRVEEGVEEKMKGLSVGDSEGAGSEIEIGKRWDLWLPSSEVRNLSRCEGVVVPVTERGTVVEMEREAVMEESKVEVEAVEKPVPFVLPERRREKSEERRIVDKKVEVEADPELPAPLKVRKSVAKPLFKAGNSWEILDPPTDEELDQGW